MVVFSCSAAFHDRCMIESGKRVRKEGWDSQVRQNVTYVDDTHKSIVKLQKLQ